eukprot:SAG31_NODE_50486_length_112_cov_159.615385_1_plen_25_part_01
METHLLQVGLLEVGLPRAKDRAAQ